jgi:hypothetical protein
VVEANKETTIAAIVRSDEPLREIMVFLNGQRIDVEIMGPSERQQSIFTAPSLPAGQHTVRVVALDAGGDRNETSWSFRAVATSPTPTAPPVRPRVTNLTPENGGAVPAGTETTLAANVSSDEPITRIDVYLDGAKIDVEVGGRDETEQAFFTGRTLAAGTHRLRVVAEDKGGDSTDVTWAFTAAATPATPTPSPVATATATPGTTPVPASTATPRTTPGPATTSTPQVVTATPTALPPPATPNAAAAGTPSATPAGSTGLPFAGGQTLALFVLALGAIGLVAAALGFRIRRG